MLNFRHSTFILILLVIAPFATARVTNMADDCVKARSLVFSGPDSVSKFYRIPALALAPDGAIVAVADRRLNSNADLPAEIDVVCRRSSDGGLTWSPVICVARHDEGGGYGDPALGVDKHSGDLVCVFTHGNGLWNSTPDKHAYIYVSRSSDGGLSWSKPQDITADLYNWQSGHPVKAVTGFASSGRILTCNDGTMWFCLVTRENEDKWGKLSVHAVRSRDGGHTWQISPVATDNDADESKMVQMADGSLLMSIRNRYKGWRKFARSTDGGNTWSKAEYSNSLPDPAINGDIVCLPDGRLLHSICDSHEERRDVAVFLSDDNGATWTKKYEVCPAPCAYSALLLLPDSQLGILSEDFSSQQGQRLWFTRVDMSKW